MTRIDPEAVKTLKALRDLVTWLPAQGVPLRQHGRQWWGRCPFHDDQGRPNLSVLPDRQLWHCWVCGVGGDIIDFLLLRDGGTFLDAIRTLGGDPAPARRPTSAVADAPIDSTRAPLTRRDRWYRALLAHTALMPTDRWALEQRGLSPAAIRRNGYASLPERDARRGLMRALLEALQDVPLGVPGFARSRDRGRWTIWGGPGMLIPVRTVDGRIQALQIRREASPRYIWLSSPPGDPVWDGGASSGAPVHWAGRPWRQADTWWVTEGPLKADVAAQYLRAPVLGIPGVGLWRTAVEAIVSAHPRTVILAFDQDAAPQTADIVQQHTRALAEALHAADIAQIWTAHWADGPKGVDDALYRGYAIWRRPVAVKKGVRPASRPARNPLR